jgi:phosphate transport system substrate-binding protein
MLQEASSEACINTDGTRNSQPEGGSPVFSRKFVSLCLLVLVAIMALTGCAAPAAPAGEKVVNQVVEKGKSVVITATSGPEQPKAQPGAITMNGAGATFPFPLYSRWFYDYAFVDPEVKFNYQSIGSGGGIKQITAKTVDFGASDAILTADQLAAASGIQMLPAVAGAVVPVYNVQEFNGLKDPLVLDSQTLADIYLGKITKWNDPAIVKLNSAMTVTLPSKDIVVVHRSDGSGTSYIFTDYLSSVSDEWKANVGKATSVKWPVGLGGKGNEGVAGTVSQNDGAIGYVELAYADQNKIPKVTMINAAGTPVVPSLESTQNAMSDFGGEMPDTLARSVVNAPGKDSWPIAGYTYLLVYMDQQDCTKAQKLVNFINWALKDGASSATALDYAALPDAVRAKVLDRVGNITCQGEPLSK